MLRLPQINDKVAKNLGIHSTALVSRNAELGIDVSIGPYAVIEDHVQLGDQCEIAAHAIVKRFTVLGSRNRVFEHAVLGGEPQDVKYPGESSSLIIGDDNLIREFSTLHRANGAGEATRVGSRNFLMVGVHVAHNCSIGDDNVFANGAALAGHVIVEDHVFLSNNVGVHQFVRLGRYAMIGGKSKIIQDVLPFFTTDGNPARVRGLNNVGLRRAGFTREDRLALRRAYKLLFRSQLGLEQALSEMEKMQDFNVDHLLTFIRQSERGFTRTDRAETREVDQGGE